jgi:hypothetical protein
MQQQVISLNYIRSKNICHLLYLDASIFSELNFMHKFMWPLKNVDVLDKVQLRVKLLTDFLQLLPSSGDPPLSLLLFTRLYDVSIFLRPFRHYAIFFPQLFLSVQSSSCNPFSAIIPLPFGAERPLYGSYRTVNLQMLHFNYYSTNICTEYFKRAA